MDNSDYLEKCRSDLAELKAEAARTGDWSKYGELQSHIQYLQRLR